MKASESQPSQTATVGRDMIQINSGAEDDDEVFLR